MSNLPTVDTHQGNTERVSTGLYSLDKACSFQNNLGYPLQIITEIYGQEHIGKSTFAYYLAGKISEQVNPQGTMVVCDLEGIDIQHLARAVGQGGFSGNIKLLDVLDAKGKMKTHENMMDEWLEFLKDNTVPCAMFDSLGAVVTTEELNSSVAEGFGAKRAVPIARLVRKANEIMLARKEQGFPLNLFFTNHSHQVISGIGHQSTGGAKVRFLSVIRMYLYFSSRDHIKSGDEVIAHTVEGRIEKLRYGGKGKTFKFVIVPGFGVRPNLTALIDCVDLGLATRGSTVKIEDKSFGYISKLVEEDLAGNDDKFQPFHDLLKEKRNALPV